MPLLSVRQPSASGFALDRCGVIHIDILFDYYRRGRTSILTRRSELTTIPTCNINDRVAPLINGRYLQKKEKKCRNWSSLTRNDIPARKPVYTLAKGSPSLLLRNKKPALALSPRIHSLAISFCFLSRVSRLFRQRAV